MSITNAYRPACRNEEIIAYLDGELDTRSRVLLEGHFADCPACTAELNLQQRLLSEMEAAFTDDCGVELPKNFAQIVAARAQSDLSGMRGSLERRRAFGFCLVLVIVSVALLGGTAAMEAVLGPLRVFWRSGAALLSFLAHALYDAGAGVAVISRGIGGHLLFESWPTGLLIILLFASALFILRRLIAGYHRTRTIA